MANVPDGLRYTRDHEWISVAGGRAKVGITDHAQRQLGDVVFVELPQPGQRFEAGEPFGSVESVKAVGELYMPVSGSVAAVNDLISEDPELLNTDSYGDGWLIEVTPSDRSELDSLMSASQYTAYCKEE